MRVRFLPAVVLASLVSTNALAVPTTYEFTAVWQGAMGYTVPQFFDFVMPIGTPFTGSFTIDTDSVPAYADAGIALYDNPFTALNLNVGPNGSLGQLTLGESLGPNDARSSALSLFDDFVYNGAAPFDQFSAWAALAPLAGDDPAFRRTLSFGAYTGEWIPGNLFDGVPTLDGAFARAGEPDFLSHLNLSYTIETGYAAEDYHFLSVDAQVTDLHVVTTSVPEPATVTLLGAGLLGAFAARRRRRVSAS